MPWPLHHGLPENLAWCALKVQNSLFLSAKSNTPEAWDNQMAFWPSGHLYQLDECAAGGNARLEALQQAVKVRLEEGRRQLLHDFLQCLPQLFHLHTFMPTHARSR